MSRITKTFRAGRAVQYFLRRWVLRQSYLDVQIPNLELLIRVKTEDAVGRHLYKRGTYEEHVTRFLTSNLRFQPGDVAFDVGANVGWYSLLMDRVAPEGVDIFAFEPDPLNFGLLRKNLAANHASKVEAMELGVSDRGERTRLYRYGAHNLGRHSILPIHDGESVEISTTTLDEFWARQSLGDRVPRFLKVDVEGYELNVLRGARSVLARCPLVLLEYSPRYMRAAGLEPETLLELMEESGLSPAEAVEGGLRPIEWPELRGSERQINLIFRR